MGTETPWAEVRRSPQLGDVPLAVPRFPRTAIPPPPSMSLKHLFKNFDVEAERRFYRQSILRARERFLGINPVGKHRTNPVDSARFPAIIAGSPVSNRCCRRAFPAPSHEIHARKAGVLTGDAPDHWHRLLREPGGTAAVRHDPTTGRWQVDGRDDAFPDLDGIPVLIPSESIQ
jgi:hypothetical protein